MNYKKKKNEHLVELEELQNRVDKIYDMTSLLLRIELL